MFDDDFWWKLEIDNDDMEFMEKNPSSCYKKPKKHKINKEQKLVESLPIDKTLLGSFLLVLTVLFLATGILGFISSVIISLAGESVIGAIILIISLVSLFIFYPIIQAIRVYINNKRH